MLVTLTGTQVLRGVFSRVVRTAAEQFDYNGRRYHVEYDTPASGRGSGHQSRLTSNDPDAEIILLMIP